MCRAHLPMRVQPLIAADAPDPKNFRLPPLRRFNHNVALLLLMRVVSGLHTSLWSGTVLASYLYVLTGSNSYAGYVEAAMGMANLVLALPAGYMADRFSRSIVIAAGGWCIPVAAGLTSAAVIIGVQRKQADGMRSDAAGFGSATPALEDDLQLPLWLFVAALSTWGFVQAVQNGAAQALFADSVAAGERSRFYTYSFMAYLFASTLGPVVSIIMFVLHGNDWSLPALRNVFLAGMAVSLPNWIIMLSFSDKKMLDEEPAREAEPEPLPPSSVSVPVGSDTEGDTAAEAAAARGESERTRLSRARSDVSHLGPPQHRHAWAVRYIMFGSSAMLGIASGMTVKFFPLWFKNDCQMSPVAVQVVYAILPLAMVLCSRSTTALARRVGRVQAIFLNRVCSVALMTAIAFLSDYWLTEGAQGLPVPTYKVVVVAGIYVLRTALMNSVQPLTSSVMMDFTPRSSRARWQSLQSIVRFGWCGSAAIGGVLADRFGYSSTFLVTAAIQLAGTCFMLLLIPLVPVKEDARAADDAATLQPLEARSAAAAPPGRLRSPPPAT